MVQTKTKKNTHMEESILLSRNATSYLMTASWIRSKQKDIQEQSITSSGNLLINSFVKQLYFYYYWIYIFFY